MNKLTLDQIGFIKKKIQQFIDLPSSPKKEQSPNNNEPSSPKITQRSKSKDSFSKSPKKKISFADKTQKANKDAKNDNQVWLKKKQKEIQQFITHENRNKQSVLNKFLNSDKIHLKKRQDVQPNILSNESQIRENQNELNHSRSFSFDNQFSDLKKVYKNIGSFFAMNEVEKQNQSKDHIPVTENPFANLLKNLQSNPSIEQKNIKPTFNVQTEHALVKPSAMKGKMFYTQQNQTPKISNQKIIQRSSEKREGNQKNSINKSVLKNNGKIQGIIQKSNSQLSLQKKNRVSSYSRAGQKNQIRTHQLSLSMKDPKYFKAISNNPSKKSFEQFFDSERVSTIRQIPKNKIKIFCKKQKQHYVYLSPSQKYLSSTINNFPVSVYKKSFKQNPHEISNYQKFSINKYKSKQISPDQRKGLKTKYELLDKRLDKILESVKQQKQGITPSFSSTGQVVQVLQGQKTNVPQQILTYQKLSPLKKFLKINKQYRHKYESEIRQQL